MNIRIVVASRQAAMRRAVSLLIRTRLGLEVVGETGDSEELMCLVKDIQPDLVVIDDDLPDVHLDVLVPSLSGLEFAPAVIVLIVQPESEQVAQASGADDFVYKSEEPKKLLIAIEKIRLKDE